MKKFSSVLSVIGCVLTLNATAAVDLNTPECQSFVKVANGERDDLVNGLQTDQIIVSQNGRTIYSWDDGVFTLNKKHSLWSASKTIMATLIGAAIQKGDLKVDDRLSDFFPQKLSTPAQQFYYDQITIDHLISMSSGFTWDESYESDPVTSSFMKMLYGQGHSNMKDFALSQALEMSPGLKWNYSGGNSVILMAILQKIYGNNNFAQELLFKPLGMTSAIFEQDLSGTLVGSSYAYMTPEDMQKVGQLYLNEGVVNGVRILPAAWVRKAQVPADSLSRADTKSDPAYVASEGVFSQRAFWLNQDVPSVKMEHEFKNSPKDMYFAAGHYGQLIIVLPTQNLVITTTGHNKEYWSKIDKLVANSVACFNKKAPLDPSVVFDQAKTESKGSVVSNLRLGGKVLAKGYLQGILAKELCSCRFISGLTFDQCLERANLPMSKKELDKVVKFEVDETKFTVKVKPTTGGDILSLGKAESKDASLNGESCQLN